MTKCYIDFAKEVCEGLIGTKECVKAFLTSLNGEYDYEGNQRVRNRAEHKWEWVVVYSFATYYGTRFVCYKAE